MPDNISRAFVAAIMERFRIERPRDLAALLGVAKTEDEKRVNRWVSGQSAPNFHYTMELLILAGWLKPEALRAYGQAIRPEVTAEEAEAALARGELAVWRRDAKAEN